MMMNIFIIQILFLSTVLSNDSKQTRNRATVPQSLTLLMNFKNDGTTSFQIMQGINFEYNLNCLV